MAEVSGHSGSTPTWYDVLGIEPAATDADIVAAWQAAVSTATPGSERLATLNAAAELLLDAHQRAEYDASIGVTTHSTHVDITTSQPPEVENPAAEPSTPPGPDAHAPAAGATTPARRQMSRWVAVLLTLAIVITAAVAAWLAAGVSATAGVATARAEATAAASRALEAVLAYDYRQLEDDRARASRYLTPEYRKQYQHNFDKLITEGPDGGEGPAVKTQAIVSAKVEHLGVITAEADKVELLAFVDQTSVKNQKDPTIFQNRVIATMVKLDGSWFLDDIASH